jgi:hypothetical protein
MKLSSRSRARDVGGITGVGLRPEGFTAFYRLLTACPLRLKLTDEPSSPVG